MEVWVQAVSLSPIGKAMPQDAVRYCAKPSPEDAARFLDNCGPQYAEAAMRHLLRTFGEQYYELVKARRK